MKNYKTQLSEAVDGIYMLIQDFCDDMDEIDPNVKEVLFTEKPDFKSACVNVEAFIHFSDFNTDLEKYDLMLVYGIQKDKTVLLFNMDDDDHQSNSVDNLPYKTQAEIADLIVDYKAKEAARIASEPIKFIFSAPHIVVRAGHSVFLHGNLIKCNCDDEMEYLKEKIEKALKIIDEKHVNVTILHSTVVIEAGGYSIEIGYWPEGFKQ